MRVYWAIRNSYSYGVDGSLCVAVARGSWCTVIILILLRTLVYDEVIRDRYCLMDLARRAARRRPGPSTQQEQRIAATSIGHRSL